MGVFITWYQFPNQGMTMTDFNRKQLDRLLPHSLKDLGKDELELEVETQTP